MTADTGEPIDLRPLFTPEYLEGVEKRTAALGELYEIHQKLLALPHVLQGPGFDEWLQLRQLYREALARCEDEFDKLDEFLERFWAEYDGLVVGHGGGSLP